MAGINGYRFAASEEEAQAMKVVFGALAPPLYQQLSLSRRRLRYLQECADGITALSVGQLLSESEVHRARQRLIKRIAQTFTNSRRPAPR